MSNQEDLYDFFAGLAMRYFLEHTKPTEAQEAGMEWEDFIAAKSYALADSFMKEKKERRE
jgi:hypothetical protein